MSTIQSGTKYINHSLLGANNDEKWYYYSELNVSGTPSNRTFSLDLYASESKDLSVATLIGTQDYETGYLTLNDSASSLQQRDRRQIQQLTKNPVTYWEQKVGSELTSSEKTSLGTASGNNNQDNSDDSIGTQVGGEILTDALAAADIKIEDAIATGNQTLSSISVEGRRFRESYGNYSYPEDLKSNKQDRIRFSQSYSEGTKLQADLINPKVFQRRIKKITGSVTLPIVTGIQDENSVDWKGATLNPIQALAGAGALGVFETVREGGQIDDAISQGAAAVGNVRNQLVNNKQVGSDIASAINVYLAQQAVGAQGLLSRTTGAILNPNLEMLFGGPQLRRFTFSFTLSPRDADEATQVRKIIRFFKQGMSVKTSASNVFLKSPNVFDIEYKSFNTNGTEITHPSINIIKTCALTSCNVQYTPNNTYMTYEDPFRTMQSYQLTMQFGELDPIYDDDYAKLDNDQEQVIGY